MNLSFLIGFLVFLLVMLGVIQAYGAGPGILHAYDATDLSTELYNSNQAGSRDALDAWSKFTVPVVTSIAVV